MERRILHLDMDAFFASVEVLDNPDLEGKQVIVGGGGPRSVVCACSYETRPFGVHSAMPMRQALERCPDAIRLTPRGERYGEISREIFTYLAEVSPLLEKMSVDEGYLDITRRVASDEEALLLAGRIQNDIREQFGLACSIGIAPCKFIAKIASDLRKPRALVLVSDDEVQDFLASLDVKRIPGVGKVGERRLHNMGVRTIAELREISREMLVSSFGKWGNQLYDYARGSDMRSVVTQHERKSRGTEHTYDIDVQDVGKLRGKLAEQAAEAARFLTREHLGVQTVTVKVRYDTFETVTRQRTFPRPLRHADEIARVGADLLEKTEARARPVRLIGLTVSGFVEPELDGQLGLFDAEAETIIHEAKGA